MNKGFFFLSSSLLMVFFLVLFTSMNVLAVPINESPSINNSDNGIPQRISLVEQVLLVNEVLEVTEQPAIDVTGTDYLPYDEGKLQVYLTVGDFPITTATCYASVLYPNMSYFIYSDLMLPANKTYFEGLYYLDFNVPNVTGVYPVNALCSYDFDNLHNHVTEVTFDGLGESVGNTLFDLEEDDGELYGIQDFASCNGINCSANFTMNLPLGWYTGTLSSAKVLLEVSQTKNKNLYWYVHAPTTNETFFWFMMDSQGVPYYEQFDLNGSFSGETEIIIEAVGVDYQATKMNIDYLYITRAYSGTVVNDLRGNEELVVSKGMTEIYNTVQEVSNADINIIPSTQTGQIIIIIIFFILLFTGMVIPASILGLAYSFIYLDGILTLIGSVIFAVLLYYGKVSKEE